MKIRNELRAGIFIAICLFFLGALVLTMGKERQIFASQEEFYATFSDVKGLSVGAPVRLGGITIGRVSSVGFSADPADAKIHVTVLINENYLERIRRDSVVTIETQGLLGDRFVNISPGQDLTQLLPKSVMRSTEISDFSQIAGRMEKVADNAVGITDRINKALEGVEPGTVTRFSEAAAEFATVMSDIKKNNGFLHRLIYSEKDGESLTASIRKGLDSVGNLLEEAKTGKGLLHALFYEPIGDEVLKNWSAALQSIGAAGSELSNALSAARTGNGLLHELLYTPADGHSIEKILSDINASTQNLKTASEALANGNGTLGALLVDPKLYDNLVEVTDDAKRSFFLRQAIRSSVK